MQRFKMIGKSMGLFRRDASGSLGVMAGLAAVPLLLAAGAAIDFARFNNAQTEVQVAVDAAALAAASGKAIPDAQRITAGEKMFNKNIEAFGMTDISTKVSIRVKDSKVVASAEVEMPTSFIALAGIPDMKTTSKAEVNILADKKAEIALVLDYSGSMEDEAGGQVKYIAMKDATKKLVTDMSKTDPDKVKFGLVPFSHHVYTTLNGAFVLGGTSAAWTGCTQDRQFPYNLTSATPNTNDNSKWNQAMAPDHDAWGCNGYVSNKLKIRDLSNDFSGINKQLDAMRPYAWTHIALGVEFGYHMLSPNAPFTQGVSFNDKVTKKFMVVLTDGMQTEPGFGAAGRSVADAEKNLETLCTNAKADGITVITMAFDLDDSSTRKRLQDCATDPKRDFFVANGAADLSKAFESVKEAITAEVYLSK
jgi:Flp pilus assembly protein TadG